MTRWRKTDHELLIAQRPTLVVAQFKFAEFKTNLGALLISCLDIYNKGGYWIVGWTYGVCVCVWTPSTHTHTPVLNANEFKNVNVCTKEYTYCYLIKNINVLVIILKNKLIVICVLTTKKPRFLNVIKTYLERLPLLLGQCEQRNGIGSCNAAQQAYDEHLHCGYCYNK